MPKHHRIHSGALRPIRDNVFVTDLDSGPKITTGGLIIPDDNMTERGVRDRWGRVYAVGPEVNDLKPGDWVLVTHGRWTPGMDFEIGGEKVRLWRVEYPEAVLIVSDEDPREKKHVF